MSVKVGTFNLNNLFSRYNFQGEIEAIKDGETCIVNEMKYEFGADSHFIIRAYAGKLVKVKPQEETKTIAERIIKMDVDVLAVQEVEDIDTLKEFNRDYLNNLYKHLALVDGNDPRLIDLAVLSKLPIGGITSWQKEVHESDPSQPIFGRDMLEVEILSADRLSRLFTLFINHLKSHYVDHRTDPVEGEEKNNEIRTKQAETAARIIKKRIDQGHRFIVLGDMNDPVDSQCLKFTFDAELQLANALRNPKETRPAKKDNPPPQSSAWTYRYKASGKPARYDLFDQIWLSPSLASKQIASWIDRRSKHSGDGSDHDPAWVELDI